MSGKLRLLIAAVLAVLPSNMRVALGRWLLGWEVDRTARIGCSIIAAKKVTLGPGANIGSLNVIKGLEELRLEKDAVLGHMNWVSGAALETGLFPFSPERRPALLLDNGAAITSRHHVDCSDTVRVGAFATVAGIRTAIFTHSVNLVSNRQKATPVEIGERAAVLTHCLILAGTKVPARSIISAGSVVNTQLTKELTFYNGVPAVEVRDLPETMGYFTRDKPFVD